MPETVLAVGVVTIRRVGEPVVLDCKGNGFDSDEATAVDLYRGFWPGNHGDASTSQTLRGFDPICQIFDEFLGVSSW